MSLPVHPGQPVEAPAIGVDLIEISDVARALSRFGMRYRDRLFTAHEQEYCDGASAPDVVARRYAGRFAAKEAAFKALRWGNRPTDWRSVEVRTRPDGACTIALHGAAQRVAAGAGIAGLAVSLTYTTEHAAAVVLSWPAASATSSSR